MRSTSRSSTRGRGASASTARSARARCGRTSPSSRASPTAGSASTRTPACRTRSASTTSCPRRRRRCSANSPTSGFANILGGCCGTTPDHIRALVAAVRSFHRDGPPRGQVSTVLGRPFLWKPDLTHSQLSGLEPLVIRPDSNFQMIGERTNVTGSKRFARLIKDEQLRRGRRGRRSSRCAAAPT